MKVPILCQGRPYEKLLYFFALIEITLDATVDANKQEMFFYHLWMYLLIVASISIESIRMIQIPFLIGFVIHNSTILSGNHTASLIQYGGFLLLSLFLVWTYGEMDFQKYPDAQGPYDVGYTMARTQKYGNEIQVFYPIKIK